MAIDYYANARRIIECLKAAGRKVDADSLIEVMAAGSTATEILMGLRWHLKRIDADGQPADLDCKQQIRTLISQLDKVLS